MIDVSIVIPIFNKIQYIQNTLQSIFICCVSSNIQTETILIDDESYDGSSIIAKKYAEDYPELFKYYRIKHKGGFNPINARNEGTLKASGKYILYLDADDLLLPGYIERAVEYMNNHDECNMYSESYRTRDISTGEDIIYHSYIDNDSDCDRKLVALGDTLQVKSFFRLDLVKKMGEKFGLFEGYKDERWEDILFTAKYVILFSGYHTNKDFVGWMYYLNTENSVGQSWHEHEKTTGINWFMEYCEFLTEKFKDYGYYTILTEDEVSYYIPDINTFWS